MAASEDSAHYVCVILRCHLYVDTFGVIGSPRAAPMHTCRRQLDTLVQTLTPIVRQSAVDIGCNLADNSSSSSS
jgi:hypothetical protein